MFDLLKYNRWKMRKILWLILFLLCVVYGNAAEMPHVDPCAAGWEERGIEFKRWLSPSVRIGGGSGTMVYYDEINNDMYILSAGHLFIPGRIKRDNAVPVIVFYHNETKLPRPELYNGVFLCSAFQGIYDVALIKFKPFWKNPWYLPVAPIDYELQEGAWYHSVGGDGKSEVAHYLVQYHSDREYQGVKEIITRFNTPRPGRSGGGLFTDDGFLVGICSRSNQEHNTGAWTSLDQIHRFLNESGYGVILEGAMLARRIPVVNRSGSHNYGKTVIPLPKFDEHAIRLPFEYEKKEINR
jgi:hypothetical protein